ncbi:MAG: heparinase II/III family protein [Mangrovibacterium sp.]
MRKHYQLRESIFVLILLIVSIGCHGENEESIPAPDPTDPPRQEEENFLFNQQDLENARIRSGTGYTRDVFNLMKENADKYLSISTAPYTYFRVGSDFISGRAMQIHVLLSAFTGLILDDERYINKAIDILCAAARSTTVEDTHKMNDALAVSDAAYAYAIGYEWLKTFMSDDQKALIQNEINEYGLWLYDQSTGSAVWGSATDDRRAWNWNGATHGALGLCALVLEKQPWTDRAVERCTDYLKYAVDETGAAHEGISYLCHGLHFVIPFAVGLKNTTGRDILSSAGPGELNIPDYIMWQMYPWGGNTVSINQSGGLEPAEGVFYLLTRNSDQTGLWSWQHIVGSDGNGTYGQRNWLGLGACLPYLLLWANSGLEAISPAAAGKPLSVFYSKGDVAARTGWGELDCFMTFNCGPRYRSIWNHADAGSVTLAAKGDLFVTDLGPGTSSTSEKISSRYHNVVLIDGVGQSKVHGNGEDYGNIHSTAYSSVRTARDERGNSVYVKGDLTEAYKIAHATLDHAYRQVFFKRTPYPYFVVVDDVKKNTETHTYSSQFFTSSGNTISIDKRVKTATIKGSLNKSRCLTVFYSPSGVTVSKDNSTGYKALQASVQGVSAKIVSLFYPFDKGSAPPDITISGTSDDIRVSFQYQDGTSEILYITPDHIESMVTGS